jgi:hypothetical protein
LQIASFQFFQHLMKLLVFSKTNFFQLNFIEPTFHFSQLIFWQMLARHRKQYIVLFFKIFSVRLTALCSAMSSFMAFIVFLLMNHSLCRISDIMI